MKLIVYVLILSGLKLYSQTDTLCLDRSIVVKLVKSKIKKDSLELRYAEKSALLENYVLKRKALDSLLIIKQQDLEREQSAFRKQLKREKGLKYWYALAGVVLGAMVFN